MKITRDSYLNVFVEFDGGRIKSQTVEANLLFELLHEIKDINRFLRLSASPPTAAPDAVCTCEVKPEDERFLNIDPRCPIHRPPHG